LVKHAERSYAMLFVIILARGRWTEGCHIARLCQQARFAQCHECIGHWAETRSQRPQV